MSDVQVRREAPEDRFAVRRIHLEAFPTAAEAELVEALRARAAPLVSLVAEQAGEVRGHILFSPVALPFVAPSLMGLAPMAVLPERQRSGVGSALVSAGLEHLTRMGVAAVVVLGHPDYYPRFGFRPALEFGLQCEYDVPPEAFMALELRPEVLRGVTGTVRYHPAFGAAGV